MDIVRKEHEELVKAVVAARGDDNNDDDGDDDGNADAENTEGTPDDPLPGVNLSGTPVIFRADVASEASRARKWCKGSGGGNQHSAGPSIASWPYPAFEVNWKDPMMLADPKMKDFLHGTFGRCQFLVRRRKPQRCMRCGKSRTGACHTRTATSNTPEYCKVAEADRTPHWRVPPGYAEGDTRQKEKQGATAREWRKTCKEKDYEDEGWEGWGSRY